MSERDNDAMESILSGRFRRFSIFTAKVALLVGAVVFVGS
jgi:hypothetical protein